MISYLAGVFKKNTGFQLVTVFFALLTAWWITIYYRGLQEGFENNAFTLAYPWLSLIGGLVGWSVARHWGGLKSALGRAIAWLALGMLTQFIGQAFYSYYIYALGIEVPYPSWGDLSFFGSVVFYILGVVQLAKVAGIKITLRTLGGKALALLVPSVVLAVSYWIFLNGYEPDWSDFILTFLDFGYPIGQALYVSVAILVFLISKDILGGMMRTPVKLLIAALMVQYIADFSFSYQVSRETWYVGGTNDFIFALAYFLMASALYSMGDIYKQIQNYGASNDHN